MLISKRLVRYKSRSALLSNARKFLFANDSSRLTISRMRKVVPLPLGLITERCFSLVNNKFAHFFCALIS